MANIVIVGAGVAGLSAGIYAQMQGHQATIYDKHFVAGGNLTAWERHGYHIDNCIHWLTGTNPVTKLYKMWRELGVLGGDIEVMQADSLYTYEEKGKKLALSQSLERLRNDMLSISPQDKAEILYLVRVVKAYTRFSGMAGKNDDKKCGLLHQGLASAALVPYGGLSIGQLAKRFKSPLIRDFLKSFLPEHFGSMALIMVISTFTSKNGGIPRGSSSGMAQRMVDRFKALGGQLCLKLGVDKINTKGGVAESVTLDNGEVKPADYVVVTADPAMVFGKLLDKAFMPAYLRRHYKRSDMPRFSSHHCAFACEGSDLPFEGEITMLIPEQYRELLCGKYLMLREFSHESSFAPKGKNILQTMIYCSEQDAQAFIDCKRDPARYKRRKEEIAAAVEACIVGEKPELAGRLSCLDVWTPATYRRFVHSEMGSFMSFVLPAGYVPFRKSGKIKGLSNVVMATQWQQPPGGLPIAAETGKYAIKRICRKAGKRWDKSLNQAGLS
ncbi:MAG: NAD(P)/FAD-dependent oxidoreductase [Clostridia bacterium]|nr:NAD(P)/FAD-dependent oxidoreductase [Clostridia bacterium]